MYFFKSCRDAGTPFKKPGQSRKTGTSGQPILERREEDRDLFEEGLKMSDRMFVSFYSLKN